MLVHVLVASAADEAEEGAALRVRHDRRDVGDVDGDAGRGLPTRLVLRDEARELDELRYLDDLPRDPGAASPGGLGPVGP